MGQLTLTCGKWIYQETRWLFGVDKKKESKVIEVNDRICYEDFVQMVIREYKVDTQNYKVELSYMYPKKVLLTLPQNTPPIDIGNQRQFSGFLEQLKTEPMRICLELKEIDLEEEDDDVAAEEVTVSDEEDDIFDYCDDSDGASSGDEDFTSYGIQVEEDKNKKSPSTKSESTYASAHAKSITQHAKLELDSLNLAVGQRYDTKDALETRLKIWSVLQQFDFKVDVSRPDILVIKCWVESCTWRVRATTIGESTQFTIRVYNPEHSCSVTERSARARQATPEILALLYVDYVGGVDSKVLPKHVGDALNMRFGVKVCLSNDIILLFLF